MMKILTLLLTLVFSIHTFSQIKGDYRIDSQVLDSKLYDSQKVANNSLKVFYGEEADKEFDKLLLKDKELRKLYIVEQKDDKGNISFFREQEIYKYYPILGIILETGGHGYTGAFDIKNKKYICGDPATYAYSPSHKYRLSSLDVDGAYYYLEEKKNKEFICLGRVYFDGNISGYYWVDEKTIHYLLEGEKEDRSKQWIAYSGRWFVPID